MKRQESEKTKKKKKEKKREESKKRQDKKRKQGKEKRKKCLIVYGHFLCSRIPPVENGPFRLDFFSTGFFWSFFLSSVELIL